MYKENSVEALLGKFGQRKLDEWLKERGYCILDAHKAGGGGAALLSSKDGKLPVMDTLAMKKGRAIWLDAKAKTQSTFTYMLGKEQHGIDAALYDAYIAQTKESGLAAFIGIVELMREVARGKIQQSGVLLIYPLSVPARLVTRAAMKKAYGRGGMVYWDRDAYIDRWCFENGPGEID